MAIQENDILSGRPLIMSFPDKFTFEDEGTVASSDKYTIDAENDGETAKVVLKTVEDVLIATLYSYDIDTDTTTINIATYTLPNDFGIVNDIDAEVDAYQYITAIMGTPIASDTLDMSTYGQAAKVATNYMTWSSQYGLVISEDATENPGEMTGGSTRVTYNGVEMYKGQRRVARFGEESTIGEDGNPRLMIKSTGMALLNASDSEIFEIRPDQTVNVSEEATVVTYQTDSQVIATSYTISDTSATVAIAPYIELSINGGEYEEFSTGVSAVVTEGVGVTVTVTSAGVTAILDEMRYTTTVDTYTLSTDTTVDTTKTYYSKEGDVYTAVIPVGDEDPSVEGWYELTSTTTTNYYPCTMRVTYSAVSDIRSAIMDMIGKMVVHGEWTPITITNANWSGDNRSDTFFRAINNATGASVSFGIGSGGTNHGIWSNTQSTWIICMDQSGQVRIPKTITFGSGYGETSDGVIIDNGNIFMSRNGKNCYQMVRSGKHALSVNATTNGTKGIYDSTNSKWIIYSPKGGGVVIPQNLKCDGYYRQSGISIYRAYVYGGTTRHGFGNGVEVLRFVTKPTDTGSNQGPSFLLGNGGYAVGSAGTISTANTNMYLAGGTDTAKYLRSYPVYARIFSSSSYSPNVYVHTDGTLGRVASSSIRYKHDVEYLTNENKSTIDEDKKLTKKRLLKGTESDDLSSILDIPVVKFKFNEGYITGDKDYDYDKSVVGLIADDVAEVAPDVATYIEDDKGEKIPEAWNSEQLLVRMLYVVQKQEKRIQELEERVKALEGNSPIERSNA